MGKQTSAIPSWTLPLGVALILFAVLVYIVCMSRQEQPAELAEAFPPTETQQGWGFPPGDELAATGETDPLFTAIGSDGVVIGLPEMEVVTSCAGPSVRYGPYTDFLVAVDPGGEKELIVVVDTSGKQVMERTEFGTVLIASPFSIFNSRLGPTTAWEATLTTEQLTISVRSIEDGMEFTDFELLVPEPEPSTQEGGDE